jgi:hypothetical protein
MRRVPEKARHILGVIKSELTMQIVTDAEQIAVDCPKGTSNNDNFFVELIAGASATVILAHNLCEYAVFGAGRRPLGTRRAHY